MAMPGIGETLREARTAAGIQLDDAERTIRIRIRYLDALEKTGAFHDLLSRKEREDNKEGLIEANVEGRYAPQAAVVPVGAAR